MDNEKKPATQETRKALYDKLGNTIDGFSPVLKQYLRTQRELDSKNDTHKTYHTLLSLSIFICYFTIEMAAILRSSFRANLLAEKRYNIKYINCIISEAYKHLYGFDNPDKQTQARSKLWNALKQIDHNQQFRQDLCLLERSITKLAEDGVADKDRRNLSFHYDTNPMSVYNMLVELGEEEEFQRMIRFMGVLDEIYKFVLKWIKTYIIATDVEPDYLFSLCDVDFFKNSKEKLLAAMGSAIETHSNGLDDAAHRQGMPDRVRQLIGNANGEQIAVIDRIVELEQVSMQVQYILIDIASASRAYLTAEHTIEKQLSLKQIIVIVYEGFNKIFGLNGENAQKSFWMRVIIPIIVQIQEDQLQSEFQTLTMEMEKLRSKIKKLDTQRQLFVHYDRGIIPVYDELHNLNPLLVFMQAHDIVKFLPKVLDFFTASLHEIDRKRKADYERRMVPTYEAIDNILSLLEKQPDYPQKQEFMTLLTKVKTGEFFDDIFEKVKK